MNFLAIIAASRHSSSDLATAALFGEERTSGAAAHCASTACIEQFQSGNNVSQ
jgi:hypothetical protein